MRPGKRVRDDAGSGSVPKPGLVAAFPVGARRGWVAAQWVLRVRPALPYVGHLLAELPLYIRQAVRVKRPWR